MERSIKKSKELLKKAEELIPCQTQCLSKGPTQWVKGVAPVYLQKGKGAYVWDADGNKYLDYGMALGPMILGYSYDIINEAIKKQLEDGTSFTLMHPLEVKVSEKLVELIPCAEMVRFGKNGSDATAAAVRIARAYTGKEVVATCGYHGWQDWFVCTTERNKGVPKCLSELTIPFNYNDIESLEKIFEQNYGKVAAVIMEPMSMIPPKDDFLKKVKDLVHKNNSLLIFDEVFTGFRWSLGGAQEFFGVVPDLACFGKALSNGMPLSALVGKKEIMKLFEEVFYSFTYGGETLSLAASLATIEEMQKKNVIEHIWKYGEMLKTGINDTIKINQLEDVIQCTGFPPKNFVIFDDLKKRYSSLEFKTYVQQECIKKGILFIGYHAMSYSHGQQEVDYTLDVYNEVFKLLNSRLKNNDLIEHLEGPVLTQIFSNVGDRVTNKRI